MNRLIFSDNDWRNLRDELLTDSPRESAAIVLAQRGEGPDGTRFIVTDVLVAQPDDYLSRSEMSAQLQPSFVAMALKRARLTNACLFFTHTHPFEESPRFSKTDRRGEQTMAPTAYGRV